MAFFSRLCRADLVGLPDIRKRRSPAGSAGAGEVPALLNFSKTFQKEVSIDFNRLQSTQVDLLAFALQRATLQCDPGACDRRSPFPLFPPAHLPARTRA